MLPLLELLSSLIIQIPLVVLAGVVTASVAVKVHLGICIIVVPCSISMARQ